MDMTQKYKIAILGGSGAEGGGLALRLAAAGHTVTIGSRSADKAQAAAAEFTALLDGKTIHGTDNRAAAAGAEIVILTVPYAGQRALVEEVLAELRGKILIDATAPLVPPRVSRVQLPEGSSAVAAIQAFTGDTVRVVSAFQNVSARHLKELGHPVDCDVLVCGDDTAACDIAIALIHDMGLRGIYAGPICNSAAAEALTSILIAINRRYKVPGAGIRITGLPETLP
jgi:8-hydroxy-5-deazaflavin:NADPH oxidoreductase